MSTRGAIARVNGDGFTGVYHHWDSYPESLGKTLWDLYHGHFKQDINKMLETLIDDHPAGWSTINGGDFSLPPGYYELSKKADSYFDDRHGPECYCHGDRHEEASTVTEMDASSIGCEWVYAFRVRDTTMLVLSSYHRDGGKMIGMFGYGDEKAIWKIAEAVDLNGKEPDWKEIGEY